MKFNNIDELASLVNRTPGMSNAGNLFTLYELALSCRNFRGDLVEIGAWCGRSTLALAAAAEELGCHVMTYDIFPPFVWWYDRVSASAFEHEIEPVYRAGGPRMILERVLHQTGFWNRVEIFEGRDWIPGDRKARLVFIDGDHGREAVAADWAKALELVKGEGWVVFDDAFSLDYPGVRDVLAERVFTWPVAEMRKLNNKMFAVRAG